MPSVTEILRLRRLDQAGEAAARLYRAGAWKVWLFGSLAREPASDSRTDLDLAVEGLGPETRRDLTRQLRAAFRCRIDVVGLEDAGSALRRSIGESRILLPAPSESGSENLHRNHLIDQGRPTPRPVSLHQLRVQAVLDAVLSSGARTVLDAGCGSGLLMERLAAVPRFVRLLGVDRSATAVAAARRRLGLGRETGDGPGRIQVVRALITNPDPRYLVYEAVAAVEVIEHLDAERLSAFERIVFSFIRPEVFVVTTPNAEYNILLGLTDADSRRILDHKFEWTRDQFRAWVGPAAARAGFSCRFQDIGVGHGETGPPTQMAVCTRRP